jgi:peptidoglycan-N-acetylglucosamine deacetylase
MVALTFDAGSDRGSTSRILDILAAEHIQASFGITGLWAQANADLLRRIHADGHLILNHTYDHTSFTGQSSNTGVLSRQQRLDELDRADAAIRAVTGSSTAPWFRPPYGDTDLSVQTDVAHDGYRYEVPWTVDSLGWQRIPVDQVVSRCLAGAAPGAIHLFHVGARSTDVGALDAIIDGLRANGYAFGTVATVMG